MITRPSHNHPRRSRRTVPILWCLVLLAAGTAGCTEVTAPSTALPSPEECKAQTDHWGPDCPQLFLKDYYLHVQDIDFRLRPDDRLEFQGTLVAWRDTDVSVTDISGLIGHDESTNATIPDEWDTPIELRAGDTFDLKATSQEVILPGTDEVFFGITFQYRDAAKPEFNHVLVVFNRCYAVAGNDLVPLESVESVDGTRLDCTAEHYETTGEASPVAMVLHNYQGESHAFPSAEDADFWQRMRARLS